MYLCNKGDDNTCNGQCKIKQEKINKYKLDNLVDNKTLKNVHDFFGNILNGKCLLVHKHSFNFFKVNQCIEQNNTYVLHCIEIYSNDKLCLTFASYIPKKLIVKIRVYKISFTNQIMPKFQFQK